MWFKACPKCEGDLYLRHEIDGKDIVCIQCGYTRHIMPEDDRDTVPQGRLANSKRRIAA
jgi:DNA-directed RNA polymerase subunit M/transcription elongation factor TFIIS